MSEIETLLLNERNDLKGQLAQARLVVHLAVVMRDRQKAYFKERSPGALQVARDAERAFDHAAARLSAGDK